MASKHPYGAIRVAVADTEDDYAFVVEVGSVTLHMTGQALADLQGKISAAFLSWVQSVAERHVREIFREMLSHDD